LSGALDLFRGFCSREYSIVADGDIDGILGASLVSIKALEIGCGGRISGVEFPPPGSLVGARIRRSILVELPPSRGYMVEDEALVFDHHEFTGAKLFGRGGSEVSAHIVEGSYPSVSSLIKALLDVAVPEALEPLLVAADLIDSGRSREDPLAWKIHRAYLYYIDDQGMRQNLYSWIIANKISRILEWADEGAKGYEKAREKIPEIASRAKRIGTAAVSWINQLSREERTAMREAMIELERHHDLVIILELEENTVKRIHMGSYKIDVRPYIQKILEELSKRGVQAAGGGRPQAGGIQIPKGINPASLEEIVLKILGPR